MATVRVHIDILDVETGLWCNTCTLPSGVLCRYVTSTGGRSTLREKLTCDDVDSDAGHDVVRS